MQAEVATVGQTAERNKIKYSQTAKWEFDLEYIENWSITLFTCTRIAYGMHVLCILQISYSALLILNTRFAIISAVQAREF